MAKIQINYDTETKEAAFQLDGQVVSNVMSANLNYDSYDEQYHMELNINQTKSKDVSVWTRICAEQSQKDKKDVVQQSSEFLDRFLNRS